MLTTISSFGIWGFIVDNNIIDDIDMQTKLYANRDKNYGHFTVTRSEICQFIGIILLSGYNCLPCESDYWSSQRNLGVPIVASTMSSKRCQNITRYIHLADNCQLQAGDKTAKVVVSSV